SSAGFISPFFQLNELTFTPNPSIDWKGCAPLIVSAVPLPAFTVTCTGAEVTTLPAASRAVAVSTCEPAGAVIETEYGAAVSSGPALPPSTLNCTPATAPETVAAIEKALDIVAASAGDVIDTP